MDPLVLRGCLIIVTSLTKSDRRREFTQGAPELSGWLTGLSESYGIDLAHMTAGFDFMTAHEHMTVSYSKNGVELALRNP